MSDIERVPSMRKAARQGVPKSKPRNMAGPMQSGEMKDAPQIAPKAAHSPVVEPTLPLEPMLPAEEPPLWLEPTPPPQSPEPEPAQEPAPAPPPAPAPVRAPALAAADAPPLTLRLMVARVDAAWAVFRAAAFRFPAEHMNDHLSEDGWTRKQMLAHIAVWHDLTADRLVNLMLTARPQNLERDTDAINAVAARVAIGKTGGEVLKNVESTFNRLRRQMVRLSEEQLHLDGAWAAQEIAGNTYEHYAEHLAELTEPLRSPGSGARS